MMTLRFFALALCSAAAMSMSLSAQDMWLHVYGTGSQDSKEETISFTSVPLATVDSTRFTTNSSGAFNRMRIYTPGHSYGVLLNSIRKWTVGPNVPTFTITTTPKLSEVASKTEYLDGTLSIDGAGIYDDFEGSMQIRGRGNSTWNSPKKPYRIKFPEKTRLCGFRKAKNYVLIANYIDGSMMRNAVAAFASQYVGMPYPNHAVGVNVNFNGKVKGSYTLMEKVGINNGSVNIPASQEPNSIMFELDTYFKDDLRACSENFSLPVMLKDPDAPADAAEAQEWFATWMADFNEMERSVLTGENIGDYIDYPTLARYLLVYNLACNQELNHPKSVFLYKIRGEKYHFGPCWDFDWAFGFQPTYRAVTVEDNGITPEHAEELIAGATQFMVENGLDYKWSYFRYNGEELIWTGKAGEFWALRPDGSGWNKDWPYGETIEHATYDNYLFGVGKNNQNTQDGMGNGGEFFLSIIMDNPEFMAEYKAAWEQFKTRLPEFWADFDAYATALEPSAAYNQSVWPLTFYSACVDSEYYAYDSNWQGTVNILRDWLEKRISFMDDESRNFGLYDPNITYNPHKK